MDETQGLSSEVPVSETLADENLESPVSNENDVDSKTESPSYATDKDSLAVQKRLKRLERNHQRELRSVQDELAQVRRIAEMQSSQNSQNGSGQSNGVNGMLSPDGSGSYMPPQGEDERIARAVEMAFQRQNQQMQQLQQHQNQQYMANKYQDLSKRLDIGSDKYDDFDSVVRDNPKFTETMRDVSLGLPHPEEVLYHIGKTPDVLEKISSLKPIDQMKEMIALSHTLTSGGMKSPSKSADTLGEIRATPRSSSSIDENTPISDLKTRIRDQGLKWK